MSNGLRPASPLDRPAVIAALTALRAEWAEAAEGAPLDTVKGSIGYLFEDVMEALGLSELEKMQVKGQIWRLHVRP